MNRYPATSKKEKLYFGTSASINIVRKLVDNGIVKVKELGLRDSERLDHIAFRYYGDGRLWWIIAAASGIGWGLQCPPGTFIRIPRDLNQISQAL